MRAKFLSLLLLVALAFGWALLLLFVPVLPWQTYAPGGIVLALIAPPLLVGSAGLAGRSLMKRNRLHALQEKETSQAAEREVQRKTAKEKHERELAERRLSCDCRGLVVLGTAAEKFEATFPNLASATLRETPPHVPSPQDHNDISDTALQWRAMLERALPSLYEQVPAAVLFPVYVLLPDDVVYRDEVDCIEHLTKLLAQEFSESHPNPPRVQAPVVVAMPSAATPADSLIGIFEQNPDLAGIVALVYDSPLSRKPPVDDTESEGRPASPSQESPQQGLIAMCLTNSRLGEIVTKIARFKPERETMSSEFTPYWEKGARPSGHLAVLVPLEEEERQELVAREILAVIHRSASADIRPASRPTEMTAAFQTLLERAFIASGQRDYPFDFGESPQEATGEAQLPGSPLVGWLVHNAGTMALSLTGSRLGTLGGALRYFHSDVNLVAEASNLAKSLGNWGRATGWAMLASAIARTAERRMPTLTAMFGEGGNVAMAMTRPALPVPVGQPESYGSDSPMERPRA